MNKKLKPRDVLPNGAIIIESLNNVVLAIRPNSPDRPYAVWDVHYRADGTPYVRHGKCRASIFVAVGLFGERLTESQRP